MSRSMEKELLMERYQALVGRTDEALGKNRQGLGASITNVKCEGENGAQFTASVSFQIVEMAIVLGLNQVKKALEHAENGIECTENLPLVQRVPSALSSLGKGPLSSFWSQLIPPRFLVGGDMGNSGLQGSVVKTSRGYPFGFLARFDALNAVSSAEYVSFGTFTVPGESGTWIVNKGVLLGRDGSAHYRDASLPTDPFGGVEVLARMSPKGVLCVGIEWSVLNPTLEEEVRFTVPEDIHCAQSIYENTINWLPKDKLSELEMGGVKTYFTGGLFKEGRLKPVLTDNPLSVLDGEE